MLRSKECKQCGCVFTEMFGRAKGEWTVKRYCSKDCLNASMRRRIVVVCEKCKLPFTIKAYRKDTARFCSRKCSDESKKTATESACLNCERVVRIAPSHVHKLTHGGSFCSKKCQHEWHHNRAWTTSVCVVCGNVFEIMKGQLEVYGGRYCGLKCKNIAVIPLLAANNAELQSGKSETRIETMLCDALRSTGIEFTPQFFMYGKFVVDAYVPSYRLVLEADGEYWHGHDRFAPLNDMQKRNAARDKARDAYLTKCGESVVRIWESDFVGVDEIKGLICKHLQ